MDATWPQPIEARFHPNRKSQRIDVARYTRHTTKQPVRSGGGLATAGVPAKIVLTPEAYVSFRRNFSRFSMSSAVGILPQPEASPRRHGVQAKQKMETLLPGLGITCEEMGAMTSNMSCRRKFRDVPRTDVDTLHCSRVCSSRRSAQLLPLACRSSAETVARGSILAQAQLRSHLRGQCRCCRYVGPGFRGFPSAEELQGRCIRRGTFVLKCDSSRF